MSNDLRAPNGEVINPDSGSQHIHENFGKPCESSNLCNERYSRLRLLFISRGDRI